MKRSLALVVSAAAVLALAGAALSTSADIWKRLHRPLHIPHIAPGSACPTSKPDPKGDLSRFRGFVGTAWGKGPAYPVLARDQPLLTFVYPPPPQSLDYGSRWSGQKVLWVLAPSYRGPVLIRGRQLDGPNRLRFGHGDPPALEFQVRHGPGGYPSSTRLRASGCYAYQIDGTAFSRLIVFEAKAVSPYPDRDRLVAALREAGLPMEFKGSFNSMFFGVPGSSFGNPGGGVQIFDFVDEEAAAVAAGRISPDGINIQSAEGGVWHVDWVAPPHWFRTGRLLVLYTGRDTATLAILRRVLGPQFAGQ